MPELPDVELYLSALRPRIVGQTLERVRLATPFLLRSVEPPLDLAFGRVVVGLRRIGKRIVWELDPSTALGTGELFLVFHLMIAGRFKWRDRGAAVPRKVGLAAFDFAGGTLLLTEASTQKRASLHVVRGEEVLASFDPGGLEVMTSDVSAFAAALQKARLQADVGEKFPEKVTAFHERMAVHGRFGKPCPRCGTPVQRIVHGEHQVNYCPACQTDGRLLADRALSKLMKDDWPKTLDELERRRRERSG
jgi:formamidopyrimidine-DNA glycosylase